MPCSWPRRRDRYADTGDFGAGRPDVRPGGRQRNSAPPVPGRPAGGGELAQAGKLPQDCGSAFVIAAAWLALAGLETSRNEAGVSSFTAGDLTIRKEGGSSVEGLREQAWTLMAPFRRDTFCFQGVRG